jgi:hypothetical protein
MAQADLDPGGRVTGKRSETVEEERTGETGLDWRYR